MNTCGSSNNLRDMDQSICPVIHIFQNQGTPSCLGAASSCLVLPGLVSSCLVWIFGNFQSIINVLWICISISNFAHIWYSSRTLYKPIKTSVASSHKHAWEWFIFGQTRQSKTKQDKARRRVASPRQDKKGIPWYWKILYLYLLTCQTVVPSIGNTSTD